MTRPPKIAGLFEGYGGLTMAARSVLGGDLAWYSEIEPAACRVLAHHYPGISNHGDVTAIDWTAVERPDVLTGGFPCTDVSHAGLGAGLNPATRSGLWSHMARAIDQLRPRLVLIENVRGLLSADALCDVEPCPWCLGDDSRSPLRALGAVLGDLANRGYDARWVGVRASDPPVRAPHERYRIFIAAHPHGQRLEGPWGPGEDAGEQHPSASAAQAVSGFPWGEYTDAIRTWEHQTGRPAPGPVGADGEESPRFAEWMMGLPDGHVTAVPGVSGAQQLRMLGNGVLPAQAAFALSYLLAPASTAVVAA